MKTANENLFGALLVVIGIFVACNIYTLIPLYFAIGAEMGIPSNDVSLGSGYFTLFYAFGLLIYGPFSDRFGRKEVIVFGLLASALSTLLVSFASSPLQLFFSRSLQGFTLASFAPVAFLYSFELFQERRKTFWIALINAGFLAAGMIGQLISSLLLKLSNWNTVYIAFSIIYLCLFCLAAILLPKTDFIRKFEKPGVIALGLFNIVKDRQLMNIYAIVFTLLFSFVGFYESLSYRMTENTEYLLWIRGIGLTGVLLSAFTALIIKKLSIAKTMLCGLLLGWVSILLIAVFNSAIAIGAVSIFFVASISLLIPSVIMLVGLQSGNQRGKALSLYSFILLAGASFASFLSSVTNYETMLLIIFTAFTINLANWRALFKEKKI